MQIYNTFCERSIFCAIKYNYFYFHNMSYGSKYSKKEILLTTWMRHNLYFLIFILHEEAQFFIKVFNSVYEERCINTRIHFINSKISLLEFSKYIFYSILRNWKAIPYNNHSGNDVSSESRHITSVTELRPFWDVTLWLKCDMLRKHLEMDKLAYIKCMAFFFSCRTECLNLGVFMSRHW